MPNNIYRTIVKRKIDNFIGAFISDANAIFKENVKLLHPGEYGKFREESLKELLEVLLDKSQSISTGFIITSNNKVSTQCDLLIYNSDAAPIIGDNIIKFFPIEEVNGIIEVKSTLSKKKLMEALRKMAANKMMSENRNGVIKQRKVGCGEMEDIATYLVCSKLDFCFNNINFKEIYGNIPQRYWHNGILSIEDGYWSYRMSYMDLPESMHITRDKLIQANPKKIEDNEYPVHIEGSEIYNTNPFFYYIQADDVYFHIMDFIVSINKVLKLKTIYNYDTISYLGLDIKNAN